MASGQSYIAGETLMSMADAQAYCSSLGTNLASIHSESDFNATRLLCQSTSSSALGCWVGLIQPAEDEPWYWTDASSLDYGFASDGSPITGAPWYTSEPDHSEGWEDCVHIASTQNHEWDDVDCANHNYPICNGM